MLSFEMCRQKSFSCHWFVCRQNVYSILEMFSCEFNWLPHDWDFLSVFVHHIPSIFRVWMHRPRAVPLHSVDGQAKNRFIERGYFTELMESGGNSWWIESLSNLYSFFFIYIVFISLSIYKVTIFLRQNLWTFSDT